LEKQEVMSILAKIKASPVKWTLGIGAGLLAVDYLIEGQHSFASSIYRGLFGGHAGGYAHGGRGARGGAAHAAPAGGGYAQPGLPLGGGYAQPGMMDPAMYSGPVFYPTLPAGYGGYRGERGYRGEQRLPGHMYGHGEVGHGAAPSHAVPPGHPAAHAILHGR
jgi:hypothetical protein